jgi:hypothetical protein
MPPSEDRIIAQVMSIGTWEDIRRLERAYSPEELRDVILRAQPGWISERSWELWRGRLLAQPAQANPGSFAAQVISCRDALSRGSITRLGFACSKNRHNILQNWSPGYPYAVRRLSRDPL